MTLGVIVSQPGSCFITDLPAKEYRYKLCQLYNKNLQVCHIKNVVYVNSYTYYLQYMPLSAYRYSEANIVRCLKTRTNELLTFLILSQLFTWQLPKILSFLPDSFMRFSAIYSITQWESQLFIWQRQEILSYLPDSFMRLSAIYLTASWYLQPFTRQLHEILSCLPDSFMRLLAIYLTASWDSRRDWASHAWGSAELHLQQLTVRSPGTRNFCIILRPILCNQHQSYSSLSCRLLWSLQNIVQ